MSSSVAPSNTGVTARKPSFSAAHPRWVSSVCPTFIREATPRGFKIMSTGVPSSRCGISSAGKIMDITPLLPCLPAILSPTINFRFDATLTLTISVTPACKSSPSSTENLRTSSTRPYSPAGTCFDVSFTSRASRPKIARSNRSSPESSVSPLGVILPTKMSS